MIRSLVCKFPKFKCSSEYAISHFYRERSFRSLSPVHTYRAEDSATAPRSVSCSRAERHYSALDITGAPQARTLCFSKDYYADLQQSRESSKWRENPANEIEQENDEELISKPNPMQFESLEQYELEAARPRPSKGQELIEAFTSKSPDRYMHLQPCHMKPYGSPDNFYSPVLIRPTNSLKYPKKLKKTRGELSQNEFYKSSSTVDAAPAERGQRKYSTSAHHRLDDVRKLSTTNRCISKEGHSTKNFKHTDEPKYSSTSKLPTYNQFRKPAIIDPEEHWAIQRRKLDISPPIYHSTCDDFMNDLQPPSSTAAMRQKRKEQENRQGSIHFRSSYSDLIKLKLKEREAEKLALVSDIAAASTPDKSSTNCLLKNVRKANKMLDAFNLLPGKRTLTTKSRSDILSADDVIKTRDDPKNYSSKTKKSSSKSKKNDHNPDCGDVCTPIRAKERAKKKGIPYEPAKCEKDIVKKIYLASKVKLSVPPCLSRPPYRECVPDHSCPDRADDCLQIKPKKLPKFRTSPCPCIDPLPPTISPKLEKLNFKFEDPPKVVCHHPPCQTPRADESNPYKFKPLKPYVPKDCHCVQPPPMTDVKLKRLPRCAPDDVCRPPRVCPPQHKCPPRADECYKIEPKKLPVIEPSVCACTEPVRPTVAPPIRRLNLNVPEPERVCPKRLLCHEMPRADDAWKLKKKKLPKFVPGNCPCEDRPMVDWNLKRLVCEEEEEDCIVPDPCKEFPRADWGCWEYPPEECQEVDPKCVDNNVKCVPASKKKEPCYKPSVCETSSGGLLDYRQGPKRKFSNMSISSLVRQKNEPQTNNRSKTNINITNQPKKSRSKNRLKRSCRKQASAPVLHLINKLSDMDKANSNIQERLLFKAQKNEKIDYNHILKSILSATDQLKIKEANKPPVGSTQSLKKSKVHTLTVASRAISTTEQLSKSERQMSKDKEVEAKEKCKNIKPHINALMCKKTCPRYSVCPVTPSPKDSQRPCRSDKCKFERVPVCCQKEEPPYSAFSENIGETIRPYTNTSQWTCNRQQYGFHPIHKKEHDPLDSEKKKEKKHFSTSALLAELPLPENLRLKECIIAHSPSTSRKSKSAQQNLQHPLINYCKPGVSFKGFLTKETTPILSSIQIQPLSTKVFQIIHPEPCKKTRGGKNCKEYPRHKAFHPQISCHIQPNEAQVSCKRPYINPNTVRKRPPFPAFSDCLDEEMESILTECPLDREKYLRMQPRFMNPPPKPVLLKPPPPIQGKIDFLKEQECLKEKLCMDNEGLTQSCSDFGKPIAIMKTKKMIEEENWDCKRMEELKRIGRWPPHTLKSSRRYSTSTISSYRNFSTLGLNSISVDEEKNEKVRRIYIRNYHALIKNIDKTVLGENDARLKEVTQKVFPEMDETTKLLKLKNNQWRIQNAQKIFEQLNKQSNICRRVKRYYTTYKIRRYRKPILKFRKQYFRGRRYHKSGSPSTVARQRCKIKSFKKECSKFTLKNCPPRGREKCHRIPVARDCTKPFSPYPAYSECKDHELVAPTCECDFQVESMEDLQPRLSLLRQPTTIVKEFPSQDRIDRALGINYYKRKYGLGSEGQTIGCDSFGKYFNTKSKKKEKRDDNDNDESDTELVELRLQHHKKATSKAAAEQTNCCSQTPKSRLSDDDGNDFQDFCIKECLKSIPCHLPEEEKYCICRDQCRELFEKECGKLAKINSEAQFEKECGKSAKINCEAQINKECGKPAKINSEAQFEKECGKPAKINCEAQRKNKLKNVECLSVPKPKCRPERSCPKKPQCKEVAPLCQAKKAKSFTQLEKLWQKVVTYFKARPNCPEPGDYKKKALRARAEKAASAAGLVVLDPNCLPPETLKCCMKASKKDCKSCPNQDPCESKRAGTRPNSPEANRRNFSTNYQPCRSYSKSISCNTLDEINKMLDEAEMKQQQMRFESRNHKIKKDFTIFPDRKDAVTSKSLQMSLDKELHKFVNMSELCQKGKKLPATYFGYSDIIPSRENILERAWRISIEAYNKYNHPKTYTFFQEFFSRVEKSIKTFEDLEKLKTENVLRELEEFLKNADANPNKKKK